MSEIFQCFTVDYRYRVVFTRDLFASGNRVLLDSVLRLEAHKLHRRFFVVDDNIAKTNPHLISNILGYYAAHRSHLELLGEIELVPGGERVKTDFSHV